MKNSELTLPDKQSRAVRPQKGLRQVATATGFWIGMSGIAVLLVVAKQMLASYAINFYYQAGWLSAFFPTSAYFCFFIVTVVPLLAVVGWISWHIFNPYMLEENRKRTEFRGQRKDKLK